MSDPASQMQDHFDAQDDRARLLLNEAAPDLYQALESLLQVTALLDAKHFPVAVRAWDALKKARGE